MVVLADHVEALATAYIQGGNAKRADALVCSLPAAVIDTASATAAASSVNANAAAAVATAVGVPKAVTSACQGVAMDAQMLSTVIGAVPWRRGLTLLREELPARNLSINAACVNAVRRTTGFTRIFCIILFFKPWVLLISAHSRPVHI